MPWARLTALIEPVYPKADNCRKPYSLEQDVLIGPDMKPFLFAGIFLTSLTAAHAAPLLLQPGTLLEELRTGAVTISDDKFTTTKGHATTLKLIKTVKGDAESGGGSTQYFEVSGEDQVRFCEDATAADYISVQDYAYAGVVVAAFQKRTNTEGRDYVIRCGDFSYSK